MDKLAKTVSYDLRNPLNVAQVGLEAVKRDCESEHFDGIERAQDRMEQLIGDMLTLSQAGEGGTETDTVDLAVVAEACWQKVETGGTKLAVETESSIQADETRLKRLLENPLRNAVEHGGDDVTVTIGDGSDGFYLKNGGPGIREDERSKVLDAGYSASKAGPGFWLSIVREIPEAH